MVLSYLMFKSKPDISVFFPCYNDAHSIKQLVDDAFTTLKKITNQFEVIVIEDGSTDNSKNILKILERGYKELKVIYHPKNKGYGKALQAGFRNASYEWIFYTDGDGQYDVKELILLTKLISDDVDFINGIKIARKDPPYRVVIGDFYSFFTRWFFWLPIHDVDCDFRLIRKAIIKKIHLTSTSGSICVELVKKAEYAMARFREVSVTHYNRKWGESQFFQPRRIVSTLLELAKLWYVLMIVYRLTHSRLNKIF